jgi:hypothetical protein
MVQQIPQLNAVKTAGRVVKIPAEILLFFRRPLQSYEHVAGVVPGHALGKKYQVFLTDGTGIKNFNRSPVSERFDELFQDRALIADRKRFGI